MFSDIFYSHNTQKRHIRIRHIAILGISILTNWVVWIVINYSYYRGLSDNTMFKEIIIDCLEVAMETVVLIEASLILCKIVIYLFKNEKQTIFNMLKQVVVLYVAILLLCHGLASLEEWIYPEYPNIYWGTFVSDETVVSMFILSYFVAFLINRYRDKEEKERTLILDVLAIQSDNHFIFNSLSTLDGLIGVNDESVISGFRLTRI